MDHLDIIFKAKTNRTRSTQELFKGKRKKEKERRRRLKDWRSP